MFAVFLAAQPGQWLLLLRLQGRWDMLLFSWHPLALCMSLHSLLVLLL